MTFRHWFRKDVLLPIFYVLVFGAGLLYLRQELEKVPDLAKSDFVQLALRLLYFVYLILLLITIRHVFTSYDLERYDPGDPASLKRLMRRRRYRLARRPVSTEKLLVNFEQSLFQDHYRLEAESHLIGRIYRRHHAVILLHHYDDRVIVVQHEPLNILIVDQLLQDCIRYLKSQDEHPSRRNALILVTRMDNPAEVASFAAGFVNFLGKFEGGTLCPFLLAVNQHRLFYPADRTLLPQSHRLFQDRIRFRFLQAILGTSGEQDENSEPAGPKGRTSQDRQQDQTRQAGSLPKSD